MPDRKRSKARKYFAKHYGKVNIKRWNERHPRYDHADGTYFRQTPYTMRVFVSQIDEFRARLAREE